MCCIDFHNPSKKIHIFCISNRLTIAHKPCHCTGLLLFNIYLLYNPNYLWRLRVSSSNTRKPVLLHHLPSSFLPSFFPWSVFEWMVESGFAESPPASASIHMGLRAQGERREGRRGGVAGADWASASREQRVIQSVGRSAGMEGAQEKSCRVILA